MSTTAPPTVVIVGGGFSGLLTAIHLLHAASHVGVSLVERAPRLGRGRAYSTSDPGHLLNVRAANMSAFPDRPQHFVDWLGKGADAGDRFVSRAQYGDYLQALLRGTLQSPTARGRLRLEQDEVVSLRRNGRGLQVDLALGRSLRADAVVLAAGLFPAPPLCGVSPAAAAHPHYVADPWTCDLAGLPPGRVLLLGTGLTMVDVALALGGEHRPLTAISRRGLAPRPHGCAPPADPPRGLPAPPSLALRILRDHARRTGWRSAVDSIRALTPELWRSWPLPERRRFLRHLRPWWDVHRHRMAPAVASRIAALQERGLLEVRAARLEALEPAGDGFTALIRPRSSRRSERLRCSAVVDCSGMSGDPLHDPSGLLPDLVSRGLAAADPLGLGLAVDAELRLLDGAGRPTPGLYAVGPLSRAACWEALAVPDLRAHAARAARTILADLEASPERMRSLQKGL